ncbi:hypothetical protein AC249_AIPGENE18158, partial [Exaiptasia diaphana]
MEVVQAHRQGVELGHAVGTRADGGAGGEDGRDAIGQKERIGADRGVENIGSTIRADALAESGFAGKGADGQEGDHGVGGQQGGRGHRAEGPPLRGPR